MTKPDVHKVGLLAVHAERLLLCRNRRMAALLILPGGKLEAGESHLECLLREIAEELGNVAIEAIHFIGTYSDRAAGEDETKTVRIELYSGRLVGNPQASSEISELIWFGEGDDWSKLAPSLRNKILPDLIARGLLPWRSRPAGAAT